MSETSSSEFNYDIEAVGEIWTPHALPDGRNINGRPVWEPPIFDYSQLIGEEYEKAREAVLKFLGGDVAKTTDFMDAHTESHLDRMFAHWV